MERRKLYAEDFPDFYDADLRAIFGNGNPIWNRPAGHAEKSQGAGHVYCSMDWATQVRRRHARCAN